MKRVGVLPVHQFANAASPVVALFAHNLRTYPLGIENLLLPLVAVLVATAAIWLGINLVIRDSRFAAGITTAFWLGFFLYGHIYSLLGPSGSLMRSVLDQTTLVLMWIAATLLAALVLRRVRRWLDGLTKLLNVLALCFLAVTLIATAEAALRRPQPAPALLAPQPAAARETPDVYYIILDAYARADVLRDFYDYDNSDFVEHLRHQGFYIATRSRSNYCHTLASLASSLNFTYLDRVAAAMGRRCIDRAPLVDMIRACRVTAFFKQHGYATVTYATGFNATEMRRADFHRIPGLVPDEFMATLLGTTPIPPVAEWLLGVGQYDLHRRRVLFALRHLTDRPATQRPVFTFAHILIPHQPFVFGPEGEPRKPLMPFDLCWFHGDDRDKAGEYRRAYCDQLAFANTEMQRVVEELLAAERPAVIIIQADHGPRSQLDWSRPDSTKLLESFGIINAFYFPDRDYSQLYPEITPVNSFRVVLDKYFATDEGLLPDMCFFSAITTPYDLENVDRFLDIDSAVQP